jgi:hypothetical protein
MIISKNSNGILTFSDRLGSHDGANAEDIVNLNYAQQYGTWISIIKTQGIQEAEKQFNDKCITCSRELRAKGLTPKKLCLSCTNRLSFDAAEKECSASLDAVILKNRESK